MFSHQESNFFCLAFLSFHNLTHCLIYVLTISYMFYHICGSPFYLATALVSYDNLEGCFFEYYMSWLGVYLSEEGNKNFSWPWLSPFRGWSSLTMAFLRKFANVWLTILSCCGSMKVPYGDWEGC